jgi:hypothetical protein
MEYTGKLSHVKGHSETRSISLPADSSGGKNSIQAVGSTTSYAKRYLVGMLLNIITKGEDDDANGAGARITDEQAQQIEKLINQTGSDRRRFLTYIGAESVEDIKLKDYGKALTQFAHKMTSQQKV